MLELELLDALDGLEWVDVELELLDAVDVELELLDALDWLDGEGVDGLDVLLEVLDELVVFATEERELEEEVNRARVLALE